MKISKDFMKPFNGRVRKGFAEMREEGLSTTLREGVLSESEQCIYYVYTCYVEDVLRYVGMGKGDRFKHCTSGKSSCSELNRDYHAGKTFRVEKVKEGLTQNDAYLLEMSLIHDTGGLYNKLIYPSASSQPMLSKVNGIRIKEKQDHKELIKQIAKVSPNITEHNFENLSYWLHECGLTLYLAEVGSTKTLVLDKKFSKAFDYLHTGCQNYPNCGINGCGD